MSKLGVKQGMLSRIIPAIGYIKERGLSGWLVILGAAIVASIIIMTLLAPWISPYDPTTKGVNVGDPLTPPNSKFPFGTNHLGQDMLSRVISGGGIMLQVALLSVAICLAIGVPIGLFSSYMGGMLDRGVCLVMDSIYAFPGLILAIAIAAMIGRGVVNMALSIAVVYIPSYFRVVRSQVLSIKEMPYVEAARSIGAKSSTILFKYILPNVVPSIVVVATVNFADAILTAAGLTFVGLGVELDVADWGWDLANGRKLLPSGAWWVITFPGIFIILLALGFTLMGEGLSEILNPKLGE
ncbi:MAG: ABC transporter permease [Candidatus Bathyarchaeia archaeon]